MAIQNVQNQETSLVLSSDAKPRLKWTAELHRGFVDAVNQLGGPDKATPKSLMKVMGIHGLTLYHLKSHLQKYRLGKSQQHQIQSDSNQQNKENLTSHFSGNFSDEAQSHFNESLQIAQALQMQMEVQRKLHEQIEVQRHLQLRIEAQGKYLQSVLMKAKEALAGYNCSSSLGVEHSNLERSQLVSMVETGFPSSSLSVLTEIESSLTSSDSSRRKEEVDPPKHKVDDITNKWNQDSAAELALMDLHPGQKGGSSNQINGKKRCGDTLFYYNCVEQPSLKRSSSQNDEQSRKFKLLQSLDLNIQCLNDPYDSEMKEIDLNLQGS